MTTGRINQVDIFQITKDRDVQRTTSEPPQHASHFIPLIKEKQNNTRAITVIVCIDSHSRLSQKKDKNTIETAQPREQRPHRSTAHTVYQESPNALEFPQATQQPQTIQFHSTKLNWFPQSSNATTFPHTLHRPCIEKITSQSTRCTHAHRTSSQSKPHGVLMLHAATHDD